MRLMSQGKDVIRYIKDPGVQLNEIHYCELSHGFNLPFNFQTTSLPVETKGEEIRQISYFRLSPLPPYKLHIIKSSLYNGEMNLLPTQNSKYKMFVMNAQEYMDMKENSKLDLFLYIRLFLKNVRNHTTAAWKYVWLPEMIDKEAWAVRQFRSFLNKDVYVNDFVNFSYKQFLPGALIIEPEHRDLVITPPFIVGIMSMTLEQVTEGSPLYARLIDADALKTMQVE